MPFRYAPLGQWEVKEPDLNEIKDKTRWPYGYKTYRHPSFESWCAATLYDDSQPDGGAKFQGLMHWALTKEPTGTERPIPKDAPSPFTPLQMWHDPATHLGGQGHPKHGKQVFCGLDTGDVTQPGGRLGYTSDLSAHGNVGYGDGPPKFNDAGELQKGRGKGWYGNRVNESPVTPFEKSQFFRTTGCGYFALRNNKEAAYLHNDNQGRAFIVANAALEEPDKKLSIEPAEKGGVPPFSLSLAAYYGLYYYPNCQTPAWNWMVTQQVEDPVTDDWHAFKVRMRLPNPAYRREKLGEDLLLRIVDPVQPYYVKNPQIYKKVKEDMVEKGRGNYETEGLGFYAPVLVKKLPHEELYGDGKHKELCAISPWALGEGEHLARVGRGKEPTVGAALLTWYNDIRQYVGDRFHEHTDGRLFGWCIPSANWLFPHDGVAKEGTDGERPGYVPWPEWAAGYNNARFASAGADQAVFRMLVPPPPIGPLQQKYAVGLNVTLFYNYKGFQLSLKRLPDKVVEGEDPESHVQEVTKATQQEFDEGEELPNPDTDFNEATVDDKMISSSQAEMEAGAAKNPRTLREHAERREKDSNVHFWSLAHSPWPATDVYEKPVHKYNRHVATEEELKLRREFFGGEANMYLQSTDPMEFDELVINEDGEVVSAPVEMQHGTPRVWVDKEGNETRILDMPLDSYKDERVPVALRKIFARHMVRIVGIFLDDSGHLGRGGACVLEPDHKREMMRLGVGKVDHTCTFRAPYEGEEPIWGPVFEEFHPDDQKKLRKYVCGQTPDEGDVEKCTMLRGSEEPVVDMVQYDSELLAAISAPMTVGEWVTTPWHIEYLPLTKMQSVFKDGEGYCAGCTRCSRPFTEYEWLYSPAPGFYEQAYYAFGYYDREDTFEDRKRALERDNTRQHLKEILEALGGVAGSKDKKAQLASKIVQKEQELDVAPTLRAPLPFADPEHGRWAEEDETTKRPPVASLQQTADGQQTQQTQGFMGFETRTFRHPVRPASFRRYRNRLGEVKNDISQGVMRTLRAKVHVGMRGYRLQRMIKYGNVCTDCATVLNSHGLYIKSGVVGAAFSGAQWKYKDTGEPLWLQLYGAPLVDKDGKAIGDRTFDPWFLFHTIEKGMKRNRANSYKAGPSTARKEAAKHMGLDPREEPTWDEKAYEEQMVSFVWYNKQLQGPSMPDARTKVTTVEISTQPAWDAPKGKRETLQQYKVRLDEKISDEVKAGLSILEKVRAAMQAKQTLKLDFTKGKPGRQAAMQMIYDMTQEEVRHKGAGNDAPTLYDPMMMREEYRNFGKEWDGEQWVESAYPNSLRIVQLIKPSMVGQKDKPEGDEADYRRKLRLKNEEERTAPIEAYRQTIYYTRRRGTERDAYMSSDRRRRDVIEFDEEGKLVQPVTDKTRDHSWHGDAMLLENITVARDEPHPLMNTTFDTAPRARYQLRRRTQSRLFITYVLHRRIQTSIEADLIMYTMSKAVRYVFSNDSELARLVVFGKKLNIAEKGREVDQQGAERWVHVQKSKLDPSTFYGDSGGNSYTSDTYETHVDSVDVNVGVEIGPQRHMPHFHALLTFNHYSYLHVDRQAIKATFEQIFTNTGRFSSAEFQQFTLVDGNGMYFYDENSNPYIDIRLFPSDNWQNVVSAYVRKTAGKSMMDANLARNG